MIKTYDEIKILTWELSNRLRGVIHAWNMEYSRFRLLFLKYAIDNYLGAVSKDDMKEYANAQKLFSMRDVEASSYSIVPILQIIENAYGINGILNNESTIANYGRDLFGEDSNKQKTSASIDNFKAVMDYLGSVNLEEEDKSHQIGKWIVEALHETVNEDNYKSKFSAEYTTGKSISCIARDILNVQPEDVFCDCCSGIGASTIEIVGDSFPEIHNTDVNPDAISIAAMSYILCGFENFTLRSEDCFQNVATTDPGYVFGKSNKIFIDPPLGYRVRQVDGTNIEMQSAVLSVLSKHLQKNKGMAVVAVSGSFLFSNHGKNTDVRKQLIDAKQISAVISLPPLWKGSSIGTNLLVLTSEKNKDIYMVDLAVLKTKENTIEFNPMTDSGRVRLVSFIQRREELVNVASIVSTDSIEAGECNLSPAKYVEKERTKTVRSLAEVESELEQLYKLVKM